MVQCATSPCKRQVLAFSHICDLAPATQTPVQNEAYLRTELKPMIYTVYLIQCSTMFYLKASPLPPAPLATSRLVICMLEGFAGFAGFQRNAGLNTCINWFQLDLIIEATHHEIKTTINWFQLVFQLIIETNHNWFQTGLHSNLFILDVLGDNF